MRSFDLLARRLPNGDPKVPEELAERHHPELYRYARSLLRDGSAEDAVQTAFKRAFTVLGKATPVAIHQEASAGRREGVLEQEGGK